LLVGLQVTPGPRRSISPLWIKTRPPENPRAPAKPCVSTVFAFARGDAGSRRRTC